ncbi:2-polyprenyl-6-methoxyphenol hydroxylase [Thermomonospora echinospora]|uniref:2-polyprenyl-6-methoxyphenol hydroxylase n=1 Tax=Thermomonospora echinospora TaxID=1992 RepID=A0A1H6AZV0_9ACTN|nr:FAD-dependent monooxygenase [Thermomonospora echinospora]SEG53914.1 2-polyprenyl-6-methoxyphenol hydroxylase [Thermomonospora echinospora]
MTGIGHGDRTGKHAVVIGGGIGGLLAARVLSESFARVSVIERDEPNSGATPRRGVPQGHHTHGLLARGREIVEELFPGLTAELTDLGAVPCDIQDDCVWYNDGRRLYPAPSRLRGLAVSRPRLEDFLRARVADLPNVEIRSRCEVVGLLPAAGGVRVRPAGGAEAEDVPADLVVNACGRGRRGAAWLAELGYRTPAEERVDSRLVYVTREYRAHPGDADATSILVAHGAAAPRGGFAIRVEGDRWLITLLGMGDDVPPTDPDEYERFAATLPIPDIHLLMRRLQPLGPPRLMRIPTSVRHRYERLRRLPKRYVVLGDALCRFNPSYGQGMTVAACQAIALREALREGPDDVARRFFRLAARIIDVPWDMGVCGDLRFPHVQGRRTPRVRLLNAYLAQVHVAAEDDPVVGEAFLSVVNMVAPPQSLFAPRLLRRVLRRRPEGARLVRHPAPVFAEDVLPSVPQLTGQETDMETHATTRAAAAPQGG